MKILLIILCAVMLLFSGGCVIVLGGNVGPLSLLPLAVAVLNGVVLAAVFGWMKASPVAFYSLVVLDAIVVGGVGIALVGFGPAETGIVPLGLLLMAGFALKGLLTWFYVKSLNQSGES